jgi:hypothetical protein
MQLVKDNYKINVISPTRLVFISSMTDQSLCTQ